jgi:signal transduction histidine kinase
VRLLGFYLNRSIRTKLTAIMIAGVGGVAIFITFFFPARQKHLAFEELRTKTASLARILAYNVSPGLEFEDLEAAEEAVSGVRTDNEVIDVRILDKHGEEFLHYSARGVTTLPPGLSLGEDQIFELPGRLVVSSPIYGNRARLGTLVLAMSTLGVLKQVEDNRKLTIIVSLVLFLIGMGLSGFMAGHLTSPLQQLTETTQKVSGGDLTYRIDIKTRDEIGHLASSFNKMVSSLREARQKNELYLQRIERSNLVLQEQRREIEAYSRTLERRVEERTAKLNQAYEELSQKNVELEKTLAALTASQERLREAEKLAVIGEIASRVAHEVLNPMTALLSRTQSEMDLLDTSERGLQAMKEIIAEWQENFESGKLAEYLLRKTEVEGESQATYGEQDLAILSRALEKNIHGSKRSRGLLSLIEHQIMRVVRIVDNLREMSRAKREVEEICVNSCLNEVRELFEDGLKKRHIELVTNLAPNLPRIRADYTELFQIFSNLVRNSMQAIEGTGGGGGEITLVSKLADGEVWVRVVDNGVGISEENKSLIFEHDFSTKSRKEGTGLGLTISRHLAREMGGELLLERSETGAGATFLVRLPQEGNVAAAETVRKEEVETPV